YRWRSGTGRRKEPLARMRTNGRGTRMSANGREYTRMGLLQPVNSKLESAQYERIDPLQRSYWLVLSVFAA
ncbi:MAG: hypothetical protein J7527_20635, partial [Chitinophagaceae bacterium]|nr:hypothetical protein [Chitinophagaceae bacterium]